MLQRIVQKSGDLCLRQRRSPAVLAVLLQTSRYSGPAVVVTSSPTDV